MSTAFADTLGNDSTGTALGTTTRFYCNKFTPPQSGSVTSMSWYGSGTGSVGMAVYTDNNNKPYQYLAHTPTPVSISTLGWYKADIALNIGANTPYWLCFWGNGTTNYYYNTTGLVLPNTGYSSLETATNSLVNNWPATFTSNGTSQRLTSIYVSYTPGNVIPTTPSTPSTPSPISSPTSYALAYTLNVSKSGDGDGIITAEGINCGLDCTDLYISGTNVILNAKSDNNSTFIGWSGACSGTETSCTVNIDGVKSVGAIFNTNPLPALEAPSELQVTESYYANQSMGQIEFYLRWEDNSSAEDGFIIEQSVDNGVFKEIKRVAPGVVSFIDRAYSNNLYQYRIRAYQGANISAPSNTIQFVGLLQATYYVVESTTSNATTIMFYDRMSSAYGWQIERSTDGVNYTTISRKAAVDYDFIPNAHGTYAGYKKFIDDNNGKGLTPGQVYYYRVASFNSLGLSPYTNSLGKVETINPYITVSPGGSPTTPGIKAALTQTLSVKLTITDNSNNETKFDIERSTDIKTWTVVCTMNNTTGDKSCEDKQVSGSARVHFYYRAKAYNATAASPWVYVNPVIIPGVSPTGLTKWYVWKGASGKDNGESWSNAFEDIDQINWSVVKPGDTVYIGGGNYNKDFVIFASGTSTNPVKIVTGALDNDPTHHDEKVTFRSISFGPGTNWVTIDGSLRSDFNLTNAVDVDKNINMFVDGSQGSGIYSSNPIGINLRFIKVQNTAGEGITFNGSPMDYNEVFGVHVSNTYSVGIHLNYAAPRNVYDAHKISKCLIEYTGDDAIQTGGTTTISDTIIRYNNPDALSGHPDGIQGLNANYLDVHNITMYDRTKSSYLIVNEFMVSPVFTNKNFGHIRIYNNRFFYTDESIAPVTAGIYTGASVSSVSNVEEFWDDIIIANNLFYNIPNTVPIAFGARDEITRVTATNIHVKNNILYNVSRNGAAMSVNPKVIFDSTSRFDNNIITGYTKKIIFKGISYNTAEDFNTATGFTGNTSATPVFENLGAFDFHLKSSDTVAKGRGLNLSSLFTMDADNTPRSSNDLWDIGPLSSSQNNGLIVSLDFNKDDPAKEIFSDASGNGNNANCQHSFTLNGATYTRDQCPSITTGPDNSPAMSFTGSLCDMESKYLALPKSPSIGILNRGTVSIWVSSTSSSNSEKLLDAYIPFKTNSWVLGKDGDNFFHTLTVSSDAGVETDLFSFPKSVDSTGSWNHLAFTWDGTTIKGYFNGILIRQMPMLGISALAIPDYLAIGALKHAEARNTLDTNCGRQYKPDPMPIGPYVYPNAGFLNGKLDDLRIYNRALSDEEIASLASTASMPSPLKVLKVTKSGSGYGRVTDNSSATIDKGAIACGKHCAESYTANSTVTLNALPDAVSKFTGWSGACSGTGTCTVTMLDHRNVTANFDYAYPLITNMKIASAQITAPFKVTGEILSQASDTLNVSAANGRLIFNFTAPDDGDYYVQAKVNAPSGSSNSFFVNMDTEPTGDSMIWHIAGTGGFEDRIVSWGGDSGGSSNGIPNPAHAFSLKAGQHSLIILGRERDTAIVSVSIFKKGALTGPATVPGDVSNDTKITLFDAALVLRYSLGAPIPFSENQKKAADYNNDGKIDQTDAIAITRKALGLS